MSDEPTAHTENTTLYHTVDSGSLHDPSTFTHIQPWKLVSSSPFDAYCCHIGTDIRTPVPDWYTI